MILIFNDIYKCFALIWYSCICHVLHANGMMDRPPVCASPVVPSSSVQHWSRRHTARSFVSASRSALCWRTAVRPGAGQLHALVQLDPILKVFDGICIFDLCLKSCWCQCSLLHHGLPQLDGPDTPRESTGRSTSPPSVAAVPPGAAAPAGPGRSRLSPPPCWSQTAPAWMQLRCKVSWSFCWFFFFFFLDQPWKDHVQHISTWFNQVSAKNMYHLSSALAKRSVTLGLHVAVSILRKSGLGLEKLPQASEVTAWRYKFSSTGGHTIQYCRIYYRCVQITYKNINNNQKHVLHRAY